MALIVCPECGRNVSEHAYACPHCGYPINVQVSQGSDLLSAPMVNSAAKQNDSLPTPLLDANIFQGEVDSARPADRFDDGVSMENHDTGVCSQANQHPSSCSTPYAVSSCKSPSYVASMSSQQSAGKFSDSLRQTSGQVSSGELHTKGSSKRGLALFIAFVALLLVVVGVGSSGSPLILVFGILLEVGGADVFLDRSGGVA